MADKYAEDEWAIKHYGLEQCKLMDAYREDCDKRVEIGKQKMLENIPQLISQICKESKIELKFDSKWTEIRGESYLEIESEDFASKFSILWNAWKEMRITNFGGNFWYKRNKKGYYGSEEDFSKLCPNVGYGMSINYSYNSQEGGSNGQTIGHAWTDEEHNWEWQYKSEITRQKEYAEKEKAWREKEGLA